MLSEQLLMPAVIVGLVALTLTLSGVARRVQQQQAARRALLQRLESAIRLLEEALGGLESLPLDPDLVRLLRRDIVDRYRMIGEVQRNYGGLSDRLQDAEAKWRSAQVLGRSAAVPALADEVDLGRLMTLLDELREYLERVGPLHPIAAEQRRAHLSRLGELSADLLAGFYQDRHDEALAAGMPEEARRYLYRLLDALRSRGPDTAHVRAICESAESTLRGDKLIDPDVRHNRQAS